MNKKMLIYLLFIGLILNLSACAGEEAAEPEANQSEPEEVIPVGVPVEVSEAQAGNIALIYGYTGNLESIDDINIFPGAAGRVEQLLVEEGDFVKQGDPIAIIEKDVYQLQLEQAETAVKNAELQLAKMTLGSRPAEIATAQAAVELAKAALNDTMNISDDERTQAAAQLASAQAALRQAQSDYDKIAWAGDVGSTRESIALENATIGYENALAGYNRQTNIPDAQLAPLMVQLAQAELNLALALEPFREVDFALARLAVDQAKIGVDQAQEQLDETVIKAPFDGLIADLSIAEGSMISQQAPIARFVTSETEVEIKVEESKIPQLEVGQYAAIRIPAVPETDFPAVVTSIAPTVSKDSRTISVKVAPQDTTGVLRSGMFANVSLLVDEQDNATLIPLTSVNLTESNEQMVYVVREDQTVEQRLVETGISNNDQVQIIGGVEPGETVVVAGQRNLSSDALVEVVNEG